MLVSGVLLFELVLVAIFAGLVGRADQAVEASYVANSVVVHVDKVKTALMDMEVSANEPGGRETFDQDAQLLNYEFKALQLLLKDDPQNLEYLDRLSDDATSHFERLRQAQSSSKAHFDYNSFNRMRDSTLVFADGLLSKYRRPTEFVMDRAAIQRRMTESNVLVVILVNAVIAVGTTLYFMQGIVSRLSVVSDNSVRFGRGMPLNPPLEGSDEIAALDGVLHETIKQRVLIETLLKESEARTRSLIENMPVGVVTIDVQGKIESINPRTEKIFGYVFEELQDDHLMALLSLPEQVDPAQFMDMMFQKTLTKTATFESRRKNGELFPVEMMLTEFDSIDGTRYLAIIQDITERAQAEQFKQELIAMVSHDLRSPLTSVQGVMTLLARGMYGQLNETGEKRVRVAEQSILRLINLVDDLLDLEKMQAGKLQFNQEMVALSSVIDRSIELVYDFAQQLQVRFDNVPTNIDVYVDERRIVQVIVNLLSNAMKFSPRDSTITISAKKIEDEHVEVCVTDNGPGIASEHVDTIFDRFHQVDGDHQHKGTGLGLAICKAIIEGHGGSIGVRSELGKGCTFWFRVPSRLQNPVVTLSTGERKQSQLVLP